MSTTIAPAQPADEVKAAIEIVICIEGARSSLFVDREHKIVSILVEGTAIKDIDLTKKQYNYLELLALRKGTTVTKEMFLYHLYGGMDEPDLKVIDVFICKLRKTLAAPTKASDYPGDQFIKTVWGRGYVLKDTSELSSTPTKLVTGITEGRGRVSYVIGPDGSPITIADLPRPNTRRWVIFRKAIVVAAVRGGLLSLDEACRNYTLTVEEFLAWQRLVDRFGVKGLRTTMTQQYRT